MYKQKHILVIDDDKKLGSLLKSFLTEKGYLVDFVENIPFDLPLAIEFRDSS